MKFESFAKSCIPYGHTVQINGKNYLSDGRAFMLIPKNIGTIGKVYKDDSLLDSILVDSDLPEKFAELIDAKLPKPNSKGSEIIRVFGDGKNIVNIPNDLFGKIERSDQCIIVTYWGEDDCERCALLVGHPTKDIDNFEATGVILDIEDFL